MSMMWFKHKYCNGEYYLVILCRRTSTEGEHEVVTSSNEAYRVVSVGKKHEYDVIELQQTHTQDTSAPHQ